MHQKLIHYDQRLLLSFEESMKAFIGTRILVEILKY